MNTPDPTHPPEMCGHAPGRVPRGAGTTPAMILVTWARTEGTKARTENIEMNKMNTAVVSPVFRLKR